MSLLGKRGTYMIQGSQSQSKKSKTLSRPKLPYKPLASKKYAPKITRTKQIAYLGTVTSTATADTLQHLGFDFDNIPNYTNLATVFDEYRLDKVDLRFVPNATNGAAVGGGASQIRSILYTAVDRNSTTPPSTLNELIEYQNCSMTPYYEEYRRTVYPSLGINSSDEEGTVTINPTATRSWCQTAQKDVTWYGLFIGASANGNSAGTTQVWNIHATYYFSFRNIK